MAKREWALERAATVRQVPPPATRRRIRVNAGLSQQQVADVLGIWRETVSRFERGVRGPGGDEFYYYALFLEELAKAQVPTDV